MIFSTSSGLAAARSSGAGYLANSAGRRQVHLHVGGLRGQHRGHQQLERAGEVQLGVRIRVGLGQDPVHLPRPPHQSQPGLRLPLTSPGPAGSDPSPCRQRRASRSRHRTMSRRDSIGSDIRLGRHAHALAHHRPRRAAGARSAPRIMTTIRWPIQPPCSVRRKMISGGSRSASSGARPSMRSSPGPGCGRRKRCWPGISEAWEQHTLTDPEAVGVLLELRRRGIKIGVLSNTMWPRAHHERIFSPRRADRPHRRRGVQQ